MVAVHDQATQHAVHLANQVSAAAAVTSVGTASMATANIFWQVLPPAVAVLASIVAIITGCIAGIFYLVQVWDSPWYKNRQKRRHRHKARKARARK